MADEKSKPLRKCLGCGEMRTKDRLIRVVRDKDGNVSIDKTCKANGRGAYICNSVACFEKCRKSCRLEKTFKSKIDADIYTALSAMLENEEDISDG